MADDLATIHRLPLQDSEAEGGESQKRRQILDGAREVFLAQGFEGASMNEIARVAGVSKGTLYVYFDSKEALFEGLIREDRRRQAEQLFDFDDTESDTRAVLRRIGIGLLTMMTKPEAIAHLRIVIGVAARLPAIGKAFYDAGPGYGIARLSAYLERQDSAGRLRVPEPRHAAFQFIELCQAGIFKRLLFSVAASTTAEEIADNVERACNVFLAAYDVRQPG